MEKKDIKNYTNLNSQMEHLACIIRNFYTIHDKHDSKEEIEYICNFVDDMVLHERIEDLTKEHQELFYRYVNKIGDEETLNKIAPDIKINL